MGALLEDHHARPGDALRDGLRAGGRDLVVAPAGDERRDVDAPEVAGAVPGAQGADDVELGRAVEREVDLVAVELGGRPLHVLGPLGQPAEVAAVEDVDGLEVRGVVVAALRAQLLQHGRVRLRQVVDEPSRLVGELLDRRRRAGQDEPDDARAAAAREVLDGEPAAPRLPEQVAALLEAERRAHLVDLVHGAIERPQRRVVRLVGGAAPELVVEDHRPVRGHALRERADVVVRGARPAVQRQQGRGVAAAEPLVPDAAAADLDGAGLAHAAPLRRWTAGSMAA